MLTTKMHRTCTSRTSSRNAPRRFAAHSVLLAATFFAQGPVAGCAAAEEEPSALLRETAPEPDAASPKPDSPTQAAAARGIDYLLDHASQIPPAWKRNVVGTLAKVAPTEHYVRRLGQVAEEGLREPTSELPPRFEEKHLYWPRTFLQSIDELERRRVVDDNWRGPVAQLQQLLSQHEGTLFAKMTPTQQLIVLNSFERLGIVTHATTAEVVSQLRTRWRTEDRDQLLHDSGFMFATTHVIYVASGYLDRRLDSLAFGAEVEVLDRAVAKYAVNLPDTPFFLDIAGEVLASRKILGLPETQPTRALAQTLVGLQAPDGSWGKKQHQHDVHATAVIVQGLLDFPERFQKPTP